MTDIESRGLFLRGGFVPSSSGKTFPVYDPHTDEVYAKVAEAGTADVDAAVDAAREAFDGPWSALAPKDRGRLLLKLARIIQEHGEALAQVEARNSGHPIRDVRRFDLVRTVDWFEYFGGMATKVQGDVIPSSFKGVLNYTLREPLGVVGQIVPWNFPLMFVAWNIAPAAVQGSMCAAYHNQGQACIAGSRLFVHESIWDDFLKRFTARVRSIRIGNPLEEATQLGPLTSKDHQKRVLGYVDIAKGEGGQVLFGGRTPGTPETARGYYVQPTLVRADDPKMRVCQEEVFGPFITIRPFEDEEGAVEMANGVPYGLGAGFWTRDLGRAHRIAAQLKAGMVWVNAYKLVDPASPFGGSKMSGMGREFGLQAMHEYTQVKSVWVGYDFQPWTWPE